MTFFSAVLVRSRVAFASLTASSARYRSTSAGSSAPRTASSSSRSVPSDILLKKVLSNEIGSLNGSPDDADLLRARILEATSALPLIPSSDGESDSGSETPRQNKKGPRRIKVELVAKDTPLEHLLRQKISARRNSTSSFYLVDLGVLADQYLKWTQRMPDVRPFYAVKCNPDLVLVRSLLAMGCGLDVASRTEMRLALGAGCLPESIIFANPCKSPEALLYAKNHGISRMTFDNSLELSKIRKYFGLGARPVLRILGDDSYSQMAFGSKFGATPNESSELLHIAADLGFDIEGISFHVGSGCHSPKAYLNTFERVAKIREKGRTLGHSMKLVDIGGGWPGADSKELSFGNITEGLNDRLVELFPRDEVELISEPGRYFAAATTTLATCVISRRDRSARPDVSIVERSSPVDQKNVTAQHVTDDRCVSYYMSDGIYGSFNNVFFDHALPKPNCLPGSLAPSTDRFLSTLYGPTCDSIDVLMKDVVLPSLAPGDWMYFKEMGAYTRASSSKFNGFLTPNSVYIMRH